MYMEKERKKDVELTILIPALNEEKTIGICVEKAKKYIESNNIEAEVLVIDNGCSDNTVNIAEKLGARVEKVAKRGYGNAIINGSKLANGKYIIMGDADDSYNFLELDDFLKNLRCGYDIVIGNRLSDKMQKGAMKFTHRYIGTPMLSFLIRHKFNMKIKDVNCGLRGYNKEAFLKLNCMHPGMEFASEMMIKAAKNKLKIIEVPISFYKDKRNSKSHLNTIRDGFRHLKVIIDN